MEADQQQEQGSGGARGVAPPDNMEPARDWFSGPCIMGIGGAGERVQGRACPRMRVRGPQSAARLL
jgi:hypothetical protein